MNEPIISCEVVTHDVTVTYGQMCRSCGVNGEWIRYLVEHGILEPQRHETVGTWYFSASQVPRAHTATRLAHDLGLNVAGIALALELIEENRKLRRRLADQD